MPACVLLLAEGTATWAPDRPGSAGATREFFACAVTAVSCFATWSSIMVSNDATASGYFPSRARGMNDCSIMAFTVPFKAGTLAEERPGMDGNLLVVNRHQGDHRPLLIKVQTLARACLLHVSLSSSTYLVAESGPGPTDRTTTTK